MLTEALREIEARKSQGFKDAYLSVSRYGNTRKAISELRKRLHERGYTTRIEKSSGTIIAEWDTDA